MLSKTIPLAFCLCLSVGSFFNFAPINQALATTPAAQNKPAGEAFEDDNGNLFMEEVVDSKPKPKLPKIPIDLSRVGVSVDPHGNIVPIKDSATDPWAGTGVKPFVNNIENTFQALPQPFVFGGPGYGYTPYGYRPYVPGYNAPGYINPSLNPRPIYPNGVIGNGFYPGYGGYGGYGGFGGYGNPYYGGLYGGYNAYGGGYNPWNNYGSFSGGNLFGNPAAGLFGGNAYNPFGYGGGYGGAYGYTRPAVTLNIGKFQAAIGSVPAYPYGYPVSPAPFYAPAFSTPRLYGGGFLAPNTTTTQTSMWKAFNLAF